MLNTQKIGFILLITIIFSSCTTFTIKEENFLKSAPYTKMVKKAEIQKENKKIIFTWQESDTLISNSNVTIDLKNVEINDSTNLEYFTFSSPIAKRNLIFFPANGLNILYFSDFLKKLAQKLELNIIAFHYRGYGKSSGKHSFKTCFTDNQKLYNLLKENVLNSSLKTDVIGISVGSVYATYFTVENEEIENLILMSPHSSAENALDNSKKNIPAIMRPFVSIKIEDNLYEIDNLKKLQNFKRGILIFQSKNDNDMTKNGGKQLFEASISEKKDILLFEKGGHFSPVKKDYFEKVSDRIKSFIY